MLMLVRIDKLIVRPELVTAARVNSDGRRRVRDLAANSVELVLTQHICC